MIPSPGLIDGPYQCSDRREVWYPLMRRHLQPRKLNDAKGPSESNAARGCAMIHIRDYKHDDAVTIVRLFYDTIHSVNLRDYSTEQVQAWAPETPNPETWHNRMIAHHTLVAEQNGDLVGFAELEPEGHVDMLYCRSDILGRGVGRRLYAALEAKAIAMGFSRVSADVSITAQPFFTRCGFHVIQQQTVIRRGISLTNFKMEKTLI
jgi:putative acetyltransferase